MAPQTMLHRLHTGSRFFRKFHLLAVSGIVLATLIHSSGLAAVTVQDANNLLHGATAVSSTSLSADFPAVAVVDDLARDDRLKDNGVIFAGNDPDQRLSISGFDSSLGEIRLMTNAADAPRLPGTVSIRSTTRVTQSLSAKDYETEIFSGTPEYLDSVGGEHPDPQVASASIAVNAPEGTRSLLLSFGPATGSGSRVSEVQAFVAAPKATAWPPAQIRFSDDGRRIVSMGWDTESGNRARVNLLRDAPFIESRLTGANDWKKREKDRLVAAGLREGGFDLVFAPDADTSVASQRLTIPFDPRVSAITILPASIDEHSNFLLPAIVSAPGYGQMLVTCPDAPNVQSRLLGSRAAKIVDWRIDLPDTSVRNPFTLRFRPVVLPAPAGLKDAARWKLVRRAWFNVFQISAQWGDGGNPYSAPSGVLSNNVISDPVSCCLFIYADSALWTPDLAEGVSAMRLVGHTLDWWLTKRMLPSGEVPGYWNLTEFLDANPSLLITAWDYFEATGDKEWLSARIARLEKAADFLASRDVDHDGLLEATQSGNAGTLVQPARSCSAYDAVNCGHKDAYCNALAYRAFRCLAELEGRLDRQEQKQRYVQLADHLKASFSRELLNPKTGLIAMWKSKDGQLHDYAAPFVNALAIEYGLVDGPAGKQILDRLAARFTESKFNRYDLGTPCTLIPVRREDYLLPDAPGLAKNADGSDTFGQYLNGGIITGDSVRYLNALYTAGRGEQADGMLDQMLARIARGDASRGGFAISVVDSYPAGGEFWTWDGKTCGYEGLLSHAWHFTQAVVMREPAFRERIHRPLDAR